MSSISLYELLSEFAYRGDCYVDNGLRKLHNSSLHGVLHTEAEFNNCFIIYSKYF